MAEISSIVLEFQGTLNCSRFIEVKCVWCACFNGCFRCIWRLTRRKNIHKSQEISRWKNKCTHRHLNPIFEYTNTHGTRTSEILRLRAREELHFDLIWQKKRMPEHNIRSFRFNFGIACPSNTDEVRGNVMKRKKTHLRSYEEMKRIIRIICSNNKE